MGAVLSHVFPNGIERPIPFASRTLNKAKEGYSQLEKEALFGVKRFHQYLYGHTFILITDHKPLTTILGPHTGIPTLAAAQLQRWALLLSAYQYDMQYWNGEEHANADALSRLPMAGVPSEEEQLRDVEVHNILQLEALPITNQQLKLATERDPLLSQVRQYIREGWPPVVPEEFKAYLSRKQELTLQNDCILWGSRVVIPPKLQQPLLTKTTQVFAIKVLGEMEVTVQYQDQKKKLNLLVVTGHGGGTSLLGRDWLRHLKLNWCELNHLRIAARLKLEDVLKKHAAVFKEVLVTGMEVKIVALSTFMLKTFKT